MGRVTKESASDPRHVLLPAGRSFLTLEGGEMKGEQPKINIGYHQKSDIYHVAESPDSTKNG